MVRRGSSPRLLAALTVALLLAACSDDDGAGDGDLGAPTTAERTPATLPDDVEAGTGAFVLDGQGYLLRIRNCTLEPVTDPTTGITTVLAIDADDDLGLSVAVTRLSVAGAVTTVTDTIAVAEPDGTLVESQRADANGRYIDLLVDSPLQPLLTVDAALVTGSGRFGPSGATADDEGLVDGSIILRCP